MTGALSFCTKALAVSRSVSRVAVRLRRLPRAPCRAPRARSRTCSAAERDRVRARAAGSMRERRPRRRRARARRPQRSRRCSARAGRSLGIAAADRRRKSASSSRSSRRAVPARRNRTRSTSRLTNVTSSRGRRATARSTRGRRSRRWRSARATAGACPCAHVRDAPALRWRILSDDVSRGPLPTMRYFEERIAHDRELQDERLFAVHGTRLRGSEASAGRRRSDGITPAELRRARRVRATACTSP